MVAVVFKIKVTDRQGRALSGIKIRITARIAGVGRDFAGETRAISQKITFESVTNGQGVVEREFRPAFAPRTCPWLDGTVELMATPTDPALAALVMRSESGNVTLYDQPDTFLDGFPVWHGANGLGRRLVVLLEGFDFSGTFSAAQSLRLVGAAADPLRAAGLSVLVVNFSNSYATPEVNALEAIRAVRAASRAIGGGEVVLAGLSAGGVVARWAATAERLPIHTLLLLDSPNRGARIAPKLQALALAYAGPNYRRAVSSPAARALLRESVEDAQEDVQWRYVGVRPFGWRFPERVKSTTRFFDESFARLRARGRGGYPDYCRLLAVANSSRLSGNASKKVLSAWLPLGARWVLEAEDADRAPGSLLPKAALRYTFRLPLGVAGATLPELPVFIPAESALDAAPGERPPFDAWHERASYLPPVPHDEIAPDVAQFVVRELLR